MTMRTVINMVPEVLREPFQMPESVLDRHAHWVGDKRQHRCLYRPYMNQEELKDYLRGKVYAYALTSNGEIAILHSEGYFQYTNAEKTAYTKQFSYAGSSIFKFTNDEMMQRFIVLL